MASSLSRRGPDSEGIETWDRAVLSHRRLAVFDVSPAGAQPMLSDDRNVGVVFNGAIYNFHDLRSELEKLGFRFHTRTDTEVLVHGYRAWGIDKLVSKLHGMFAFGLWDDSHQKLFLVRDRLGVKPLLYVLGDRWIAFASTASALLAGGFVNDIDDHAVAEFLEFGFITDDRSIYRAARKVPAAHIVEWTNGKISLREYWQPSQVQKTRELTFEDAIRETERLLLRAVEMRLQADVPVGALLSGGIDSSLVCWAIRQLGGNVTAFTVSTPGDPWDESTDARATAAELGINHRVLQVSAEESPDMRELISAYGEPFACSSALGMLRVSRAVRQEATVLLTGEGGDDVFLGYVVHPRLFLAQRIAQTIPQAAAPVWARLRPLVPKRGSLRRAVHFIDYATGGLGAVVRVRPGLPWYRENGFLGDRLASRVFDHRRVPWSSGSPRRVFDEFLEFHRKTSFVGEYMTKVDGATMYYGLEARAPFLDQDLWAFASSLPYGLRLHRGRLKATLREIARRRIGERVARLPKRGFGIPVQRWITAGWREDVEVTFRNSALEREGWIHSQPVLKLLDRFGQGQTAPAQLWYLYVLESWMRKATEMRREAACASL